MPMLNKYSVMRAIVSILFYISLHSALLAQQQPVRFAVIGDYGKWYTGGEVQVSDMIHKWDPDFIITAGDNNYEHGADSTIDSNIGQFYHDYIFPYYGTFGPGASENKFFPSLGNHDYLTGTANVYFRYFTLPGNERYYNFVKGNCEFFALNSDVNEPDGVDSSSVQAQWLKAALANSTARFKIVYFHHAPYSSGMHGNVTYMQWPYKRWGASVVITGHEHDYERLVAADGLTYYVNGLGGKDWRDFNTTIPESRYKFTGNFGAMLVTAYNDSLNLKFYAVPDSLKDDTTLIASPIGIIQTSEIADEFMLSQNYPNPFNPVTKISFTIPSGAESEIVTLKIYDVLGTEIQTLVDSRLKPGSYEIEWNAANYSSGIYLYKLSYGSKNLTGKMILAK